uniref:Solute carrier organic anion transporter family member 3A1-like n=1 Tax=Saccoglossus kowalevskii TaxID=10224 RepID=A0ABM0LUC1_SACKO|nr:PREDICTED: solute carrier organic anion transporter family member 3A1-like [Saccoglossus kowalevskii]
MDKAHCDENRSHQDNCDDRTGDVSKKSFEWFHNIRSYVALLFTLIVVESAMFAYIASVLTTLERRYSFTFQQVGILITSSQVSTLVCTPFVAYFLGGPNHHRPRWVAVGTLLSCLGIMLCVLPQFLSEPYAYDQASNNTDGEIGLCSTAARESQELNEDDIEQPQEGRMAFNLYFLGRMISGIGGTFYSTLGYSYVDDFSGKKSAFHIELLVNAWNMLKNPIFILTVLAYAINNPVGFVIFLPKYFQKDLGFTFSTGNLIIGFLWLFPNFPACLVCGYIIKRLKLKLIGLMKCCIILVGVIVVSNGLAMVFPCEGPYLERSRDSSLITECNTDCDCKLDHYQPVCGSNSLNYYSPCYAGCSESIGPKNYTMCSCIDDINLESTFASDELCIEPKCNYIAGFMFFMAVFAIANATISLPVTMVTLRCVDENKKSYSLGMKNTIRNLLLIPYSIVAGKLIDSTCILWREEGGERGACAQYDNYLFRVVFLGASCALSGVSFIMFCFTLFLLKRRQHDEEYDVQIGMTTFMWLFPEFPVNIALGYFIKWKKLKLTGLTKCCIIIVCGLIVLNGLALFLPCEGPYLVGSRCVDEGKKSFAIGIKTIIGSLSKLGFCILPSNQGIPKHPGILL